MHVSIRVVAAALAAGCAVALFPGTANAGWNPEPWEPWKQPEWRAEAGEYCDFAIQLEVISEDIERRVLDRHSNGAVRLEEYRGPLNTDFINEETGERFNADASGRGVFEYHPDGSDKSLTTIGPVGNGAREGDGYPRGYYIMEGFHHFTYDGDGAEYMTIDGGEEISVCDALE